MDAALPNPSFMACGVLPRMQRAKSIAAGGAGASIVDDDDAGAASSRGMQLCRPTLGYVSSVAALERPPAQYGEKNSRREADVDNGADTLIDIDTNTPSSSACTSLTASPESTTTVPLGAAAPSRDVAGTPTDAAAVGGGGGGGGQNNNTAAASSPPPPPPPPPPPAAAAAGSLWRRAFGFTKLRPGAQRSTSTTAGPNSSSRRLGSPNNNNNMLNFHLLRGGRGVTFDESALPVCLVNKSPHWNEALRCWCLNFRGRVKLASVKNFQLVKEGDEEAKVTMQFGKFTKDLFILDFNPMTMSAIQAFAVALTTFDGKVTL
jgi:hypothetical protein